MLGQHLLELGEQANFKSRTVQGSRSFASQFLDPMSITHIEHQPLCEDKNSLRAVFVERAGLCGAGGVPSSGCLWSPWKRQHCVGAGALTNDAAICNDAKPGST